ncbi:hypothetical protein [Rhizobium mongolense]|uniref:hypothetical protein n=1 Tax=Rhizobium mongolense TaxID=57676 RepID=UPI0034A366FC
MRFSGLAFGAFDEAAVRLGQNKTPQIHKREAAGRLAARCQLHLYRRRFAADANNNLYWDGKLLQTATTLGRTERLIALAVAFSTIAVAIIEAIRLVLGR